MTIEVFADSSRGVYIPRHFAHTAVDGWTVHAEDRVILSQGPDNDEYWDTWVRVLATATFADSDGNLWRLHQDGDLFCYSDDTPPEELRDAFDWEIE